MTNGLHVDQTTLNFTILAVRNQGVSLRRAQYAAVTAAGRFLLSEVRKSLTYSGVTQRDLDRMGNPYARRHGSIQLSKDTRGGMLRDGRHGVHRQSGRLARALTGSPSRVGPQGGPTYRLGVNEQLAPYWRYLTRGTRRMLPRDPIWETAQGPATLRGLRLVILRTLGKEMRSQASVRFTGITSSTRIV